MKRFVAIASLVVAASHAGAAVVTTVIDVPDVGGSATHSRSARRRRARVHRLARRRLGLLRHPLDGTMHTLAGACSPPVRNMFDFAAAGIAVVVVNATTYRSTRSSRTSGTRHDVPGVDHRRELVHRRRRVMAPANLPLTVPLGCWNTRRTM
jgi:hypothetical protein